MKLLVVGPDIRDIYRVKNFTGVQAFYIARELRRRGVEMHFVKAKHPDLLKHLSEINGHDCDHALALGLRWFTHQPAGCATILKTKVKGGVTQLHDGVVHDYLAPWMTNVDCTFMFRDDRERIRDWIRYCDRYHYIGWAADHDYLYPEQRSDELRILLDHPYYKSGQPDITEAVTKDATMFAHGGEWRHKYKSVRVRRLINGGAEDVTIRDEPLKMFDRVHVPFPDICNEYRKTHVYMVTHKESVGLTCLELAMCGALVVAPKGMIYQDRLDTVRHVLYEGVRAPWTQVLDDINIMASAELARAQTWSRVVDRMLAWFGEYRRYRKV
jgi:pterin-4a-carbinolamine dehydratase